jgi:hypothetical protein
MQPFITVQVEKSLNEMQAKNETLAEDTLFNVQEFNEPASDIIKVLPSSPGTPNSPSPPLPSMILVEE